MRNKRLLALFISVIVLISCLSVTSFAFLDEYNYILDCKDFYIEIPTGFKTISSLNNKNYAFSNKDGEYIYITKVPNAGIKSGFKKTDNETIKSFYKTIFNKIVKDEYFKYDIDFNELYKEKLNGAWCCYINGYYNIEVNKESEAEFLNFNSCLVANMDSVFFITYACNGESFLDNEFLKNLIETMKFSGPYVLDEKFETEHKFNDKKDFFDDIKNPAYSFNDSSENIVVENENDIPHKDGIIKIFEKLIKIYPVFVFIFSILPTIILIIILVFVVRNYSINKNKLQEYVKRYGDIDRNNNYGNQNYYTNTMPQYNNSNSNNNGYYPPYNGYNTQPQNMEQNSELNNQNNMNQ